MYKLKCWIEMVYYFKQGCPTHHPQQWYVFILQSIKNINVYVTIKLIK